MQDLRYACLVGTASSGTNGQSYSNFSMTVPTYNSPPLASYTYNSAHLPLTQSDALGNTTTFTYTPSGQISSVTDPLNHTTNWFYVNNYLDHVNNPAGQTISALGYDGFGRPFNITDGDGVTVTVSRDGLGRITRRTYSDQTYDEYLYNQGTSKFIEVQSYRDRLGNVTQFSYNGLGQLTGTSDSVAATTITPCIGCSGVNYLKDGKNHEWTITRDIQNRVTSEVSADAGSWGYQYDINGNLFKVTDPNSNISTRTFDAAGRLKSETYADASDNLSYTYDSYPFYAGCVNGLGRLCRVVEGVAGPETTFAYDPNGRVTQETRLDSGSVFVTNYHYDAAGNPDSLTAPTYATIATTFDPADRATTLTATPSGGTPLSVLNNVAYSGANTVISQTYGNQMTEVRSLNADGRLAVANMDDDTDSDGMWDSWESANGLSQKSNSDATSDLDQDGLSNLQEMLRGTDPRKADSDGDGINDSSDPSPLVGSSGWMVPIRGLIR